MAVFRMIPLLLFPMLLYAVVSAFMSFADVRASLSTPFIQVLLPSGAEFMVTRGYAFTTLAALCLFIEIVKSTTPSASNLVENGLAFVLFVIALILFLLVPQFGTMEFFLMMVMTLLDFMTSFIVMVYVARRDVAYEH